MEERPARAPNQPPTASITAASPEKTPATRSTNPARPMNSSCGVRSPHRARGVASAHRDEQDRHRPFQAAQGGVQAGEGHSGVVAFALVAGTAEFMSPTVPGVEKPPQSFQGTRHRARPSL